MEILSKVHAKNLVKWAADKPRAYVLSADLTGSTEIDLFKSKYPDRFLSMGIAEQNMLSFAGGLAREGFLPLVHTFAVFIYRRAYDQISMSVCYPNLPVIMFGFLPGITTPGGATHQAIEDIAVLRGLPNLTILECGDATDVESAPDAALSAKGPVYVRMLRGDIPRLFSQNEPMKVNRSRILSWGNDLALLTSGICTEEAMKAVKVLKSGGIGIEHLHVSTHKPFTDLQVLEAIKRTKTVITMENHTVMGGLGTAVAEMIAEAGLARKLVKIGLNDTFAHGAGKNYLMKKYGIDGMSLIKTIEKMTGRKFNLTENDLNIDLKPVSGKSNAEDL